MKGIRQKRIDTVLIHLYLVQKLAKSIKLGKLLTRNGNKEVFWKVENVLYTYICIYVYVCMGIYIIYMYI